MNNENGFPEDNGLINPYQNNMGSIINDTHTVDWKNEESSTSTVKAGVDFDYEECMNSIDAEQKKLEEKMEQLMMRKMQIKDWRNGIEYYKKKLAKANEQIEIERENNRELLRQIEEKDKAIENLSVTVKNLQESINEVRTQKKELEMKLTEMKKISEGMAEKASEEAVLGFMRRYVNHSRRKTSDKRAFAKQATLEIANANGLDLPEDLKATIESLDDENPEPKVINVAGNLNDIHDNTTVNQK